ncbi:two-component sensor [Pseudomonas straminea]|uniref:histidine kinase n=1 Tax=Pseudomonas straminea TaxID=47882 RepID=A0A1I1TUW1_PSEOC|nr:MULTISPECIES: sensor histidine kinase [Pseudomonas]TWE09501.1 two-component system sensor histidine kinase TctE [Pseudomonas sp. AG1028]GLX13226.1 two-component sensor [Pseudomonas straminea]SFD61028.1 two-component system, OmpR family, sensor histidine kinase TctE [Pseudomonas straminea]
MDSPGSLRGRLIRRLAVLFTVILLVSSVTAYWSARHAADTAYDRTLLASARAISDGLYAVEGMLSANVPYIALDTFAYDNAGRIYYQVLGPKGELVSGYEDLPAAPPNTPRTNDYPALAKFYDGEYRGQGVRLVSFLQPVSEPGYSGVAEIRVAETQGARERMTRELLLGTLWRMGLLSLSALLLVWLAVSAGLQPLESLRRAVAVRSSDDLSPLPDADMPRELRPLVNALNQFNDRLRSLFERQSQFIADASHELRTPLAALKARVELGLRDQDPRIWHATLEDAALNADRLTHLANQLLSLARIESGARAIAEGGALRLDLSQLARELGMALAPLAHSRGVALALEAEQPVWIRGEPTLLNELLCNLVDNAMAYTEVGGNVILRVLESGVLEVEDDGPGIPEEDWERVFERFYRRQPQGLGAGLGLAIVGEICRAHRADISLHQASPHGLLVRVVFPGEPD